jgi:putative aminopeptidase FrvX
MNYVELLKSFMTTFAPSGYEKNMAYLFKSEMGKTADKVVIDRMGNVIAEYKGTDEKSPVVMAFAHLDQLGFIVRKIEKDGFIQLERCSNGALKGYLVLFYAFDGIFRY